VYYFCGKKSKEKHLESVIMQEYIIVGIIILFVAIYIYSYYKYPQTVSILQTRPYEFKTDMLLERQPIVIENNASDLDELKATFFRFNPTEEFNLSASDIWHRNRYKYVAIQLEKPGEIILCPPRAKIISDPENTDEEIPDPTDANLLAIQAKTGEIVIIPFHWRYLITSKLNVKCLGIHDYVTYFLP
jgi:hypothetical protein